MNLCFIFVNVIPLFEIEPWVENMTLAHGTPPNKMKHERGHVKAFPPSLVLSSCSESETCLYICCSTEVLLSSPATKLKKDNRPVDKRTAKHRDSHHSWTNDRHNKSNAQEYKYISKPNAHKRQDHEESTGRWGKMESNGGKDCAPWTSTLSPGSILPELGRTQYS